LHFSLNIQQAGLRPAAPVLNPIYFKTFKKRNLGFFFLKSLPPKAGGAPAERPEPGPPGGGPGPFFFKRKRSLGFF